MLSRLTGDATETAIPTQEKGPHLMAFSAPSGVCASLVLPGPRVVAAGRGETLPKALRSLADAIEREEAEFAEGVRRG